MPAKKQTEDQPQPEATVSAEASSQPEVQLVMPQFTDEIDRLEEMVRSVAEEPAGTMTGLEEVQNGLIENLDRLNKYIEDYVEVLGNSRKKAS